MSSNREWGYVVGAVVGYFTGGASYIALGATAGGIVGGLLDPKAQTQGPRLDDLKVQFSTYGVGIPRVYGTERVSPNVIWSTDKIETSLTTSSGKGGGVENTSYRYYVQMRLLLCETPRDGADVNIVQMFQDGKLIYDARSGIPVESALASAENPYAYFTLYQGRPDQLPDPVEELYESGPGSVPAYRGVVSISMKGIECPGGRVPQFSFVLSQSSVVAAVATTLTDGPPGVTSYHGQYVNGGVWHTNETDMDGDGVNQLEVWYGESGVMTLDKTITLNYSALGFRTTFVAIPAPGTPEPTVVRTRTAFNEIDTFIDSVNLVTGAQENLLTYTKTTLGFPYLSSPYATAAFDPITSKYVIFGGETTDQKTKPVVLHEGGALVCDAVAGVIPGPASIYGDQVYVVTSNGADLALESFDASTGAAGPVVAGPALVAGNMPNVAISISLNGIFVMVPTVSGVGSRFFKIGSTWDLMFTATIANPFPSASTNFYSDGRATVVGPSDVDRLYQIVPQSVDVIDVRVSDVIAAECEAAEETRYDVSAIPDEDTIRGYKISAPASARANIDPLLTAFQIFIVDEDGAIKFKKYADIVSVADVAYEELGQAEDGSEPSDPMPLTRFQEIDLPRSVAVSYIEPENDYQVATEKEIRQVTEATEDMLVQLPVALGSSDQAKKAASNILFSRWRSQNTRTLKLSRKFAFLSPGDGITVEYPKSTFRLWRITSVNDTGALIELNVEPGDGNIYEQEAAGATGYVGQQVAPLASQTRLQLLDIPILRDEDNNAGIYAAMDNLGPYWDGAELFQGVDDASLTSRGTVPRDAPIGSTENALGAWDRRLVDETNLLTVNIGNNDFNNVTRDELLAGNAEYWACGAPGRWEIGASATGDSLGSGRYILSRHLRGLFGTERFADTHVIGDNFVLLRIAGMLRPNAGVSAIGQSLTYRAVSKGRAFASAQSQTYTNMAEGLEPLSPVNLRRNSSNDLSVDRRSRLSMNNATGALPLGETAEAYAWEFYTSGSYSTLIGTVETTSATVTSAQQGAIGVTPGATVYVRVYQISDTVGRGHELQASI